MVWLTIAFIIAVLAEILLGIVQVWMTSGAGQTRRHRRRRVRFALRLLTRALEDGPISSAPFAIIRLCLLASRTTHETVVRLAAVLREPAIAAFCVLVLALPFAAYFVFVQRWNQSLLGDAAWLFDERWFWVAGAFAAILFISYVALVISEPRPVVVVVVQSVLLV